MIQRNKREKLSFNFIDKLAEISVGYLSPKSFEELINLFETEASSKYFSPTSESNLLRIILGMYDKIAFFNDCLNYPHYVELLVSISSSSNYLSDILVRNPEYFYWIVNPSNLNVKLDDEQEYAAINKLTGSYNSLQAKVNALRLIKRKEILRIGTKDIFSKTPVEEVTNDLSVLAKVITRELFSICYNEILKKYQLENVNRSYALIALGKLGGNELNYSSDIDLMIFYDEDEEITKNKNYQEILIEAIYLFIDSASRITDAGYIYRVDFRLRPDGRHSLLTRTINYYLNYYESRGEDWEKQMLIKSSFVGGDKKLYDNFINYLTPFIYPSSFSFSPTEQISRLKNSIEKRPGIEENIKLSAGGIRDIEFSVQALQIINGGRNKSLRTPNTLTAIEKLAEIKLLSETESAGLKTAYIFYRRIEHFLQLMNDKQTHTIPADGDIAEGLSSYLGFSKIPEFKKEVNNFRNIVSGIYKSIMGSKSNFTEKQKPIIEYHNKIKAENDLLFLREGKGLFAQRQFDKETTNSFLLLEPQLVKFLSQSLNPDLVLQNFARVIRAESFPSIWYKEFANKKFFNSFLIICQFSQKAIDLFAEDESLREYFLTRKVFEKVNLKKLTSYSTAQITFALLTQFTLGLITADKVSKYLTLYFKGKIDLLTASDKLKKKINSDFFIAGLGSFGSGDLSFASDIDIIFVVKEIPTDKNVQKYFQSLFLKLKDELKPFEVDCRLRPEGKSSWLAWDLKSYKHYLNSRARIWELQSFCKMSFVCGNKILYNKFLKIIKEKIESENKDRIKKEILEMRKKLYPQNISLITKSINLKKSRGGITDIEFVIQYLMLCNPQLFLLCSGKSTAESISEIIKRDPFYIDLEPMISNFSFLKNLELVNQNIFNTFNSILSADEKKLKTLSSFLNYESTQQMIITIQQNLKSNQMLFENYLGK